jgi:hypothetical protein
MKKSSDFFASPGPFLQRKNFWLLYKFSHHRRCINTAVLQNGKVAFQPFFALFA